MTDITLKRPMRVYEDTSVFGGALDREFREISEPFFAWVRLGGLTLVVSSVVLGELAGAPQDIRDFFEALSPFIERVGIESDACMLQDAYLRAQVVSTKWEVNAQYIAVARDNDCRAILSWNFKYIANAFVLHRLRELNEKQGLFTPQVCTPEELLGE